ncbi:SBBP repeat-containing protein [bacterium]|nr:SBBP repeat-containing protein [bacterium]
MNKYIINIFFLFVIATSITGKSSAVVKRWTRIWGSSSPEYTYGIAADNNSNIYVVGETFGSFDGQSFNGNSDIFITKYNINGERLWSRIQGSNNIEIASAVTVDLQGNVILAGGGYGGFNNQTNAGYVDNIIMKFDSFGSHLWTRIFGSVTVEEIFDVTTDSNDNIFVTGYTLGEFDGQTNSGNADIFLSKYSADGLRLWTKFIGGTDDDYGRGIALDVSNNIYVVGFTDGEIDGHTQIGYHDLFLTKLNPSGEKIWSDVWGTTTNDYCYAIALDSSENIYITGYTKGEFAGQPKPGLDDFFLTKYSPNGSNQWTKVWGSWDDERARGIAIDDNDNIFVSGHTWNEFDGQYNAGGIDVFLSKFNSSGERQWSEIWGSDTIDYYGVVAVDNNDNIYVAGDTYGEFDGQVYNGNRDAFLTRFDLIPEPGFIFWIFNFGFWIYYFAKRK